MRPSARTVFLGVSALACALAFGFELTRSPAPPAAIERSEARFGAWPRSQAPAQNLAPLAQSFQPRRLIVPVERVAPAELADTWGQTRSEGRAHEGIDISAPEGARVLAVADGRIVKFFDSERGGITIYQFDASERFLYYYAHLQARATDLAEGDPVRQGEVIGNVGRTGNASVPHLHFEIQRLSSERRWWIAASMNPYPFLVSGRAPVA